MALGQFEFPKVFQTSSICLGPTVTAIHLTVYFEGDITFYVTADGGTNWETVTLSNGTRKKHNFNNSGTDVRFMAVGTAGAKITTQKDDANALDKAGVKIEISETA